MASWLLFTSLGLYPQAGTTTFMIGSPRVKDATLSIEHLDGSLSNLEIITYNNSPVNVFVERLLINGIEHSSTKVDRSVLAASEGCRLEFYMSNIPQSGLCSAP